MHDHPLPCEIRRADRKDTALLLEMIRELAAYERLAHEVSATEELLEASLFGPTPGAEAFLALDDESPAGFALFFSTFSTFLGRPGIHLEDLFVRERYRGRGIGKLLLREVARLAMQRNCGRLEWSVLDWNQPSIEFYRSLKAVPMSGWTTYRLTEDAFAKVTGNA